MPGCFVALISINVPSNGDLTNLLKSVRKKCPRVPVSVRGGGCNRYLGNAQMPSLAISLGLPLEVLFKHESFLPWDNINTRLTPL